MKKTILITGATDGIGALAAEGLAQKGHRLLLHGRNPKKLEAVSEKLDAETHRYVADFSDLSAVAGMADKVAGEHEHIDVIINNAGVLKSAQALLASGQDIRFVVNTLAPYVLTEALKNKISEKGRVVNVSSAAQAPVNIDALLGKARLADMDAYSQSKLAITIWTFDLAARLGDGQVAVAVNPGSLLASKMVKEGFGVAGNDLSIGANILQEAALSQKFSDANGRYFDNDAQRFAPPHAAALDAAHSHKVMDAIKTLVG